MHWAPMAGRIPPNPFESVGHRVAQLEAAGRSVIDLTKGNPDIEPADFIREAAAQAVWVFVFN